MRFQQNQQTVGFGYPNLSATSPVIIWGSANGSLGSLEFRYVPSLSSGTAFLTATMRNDGSTVFGDSIPIQFGNDLIVGIYSKKKYGLNIYMPDSDSSTSYAGYFKNDAPISDNFAVAGKAANAADRNFAVYGSAGTGGSSSALNYGVYGEAQDPGSGGTYYAGFFDGDVTVTGTFTNPSDKKLKENIEPEENILEQIEKLNPVIFQFKDTEKVNLPTGLQHGFIAQELEKVFPELVKDITKPVFNEKGEITENTTFKSVNYIGMISILAQSVKELNAEVDRLEKEINETPQTYVVLNNTLNQQEIENLEGKAYVLEQNIPNPFNGQTVISYKVPENDKSAVIMIFDMTGKLLKKYGLDKPQGSLTISGNELGKGIFLYSLISNGQEIITKRMIIE